MKIPPDPPPPPPKPPWYRKGDADRVGVYLSVPLAPSRSPLRSSTDLDEGGSARICRNIESSLVLSSPPRLCRNILLGRGSQLVGRAGRTLSPPPLLPLPVSDLAKFFSVYPTSETVTSPRVMEGDGFGPGRLWCRFKASSATKPRLVLAREPPVLELRSERLGRTEALERGA